VEAWATPQAKDEAKTNFKRAIISCLPMIAQRYYGPETKLDFEAQANIQAVNEFVDRVVEDSTPQTEKAAELLKTFYQEKERLSGDCDGESMEYATAEFVAQSNFFHVVRGHDRYLKFLGRKDG
jgi:hypothetical protein